MPNYSNTITKPTYNETLFNILYEIALAKGDVFFNVVVESISRNLGVKYVLIGQFLKDEFVVKAKSLWANGDVVANYKYNIKHTPCEHVLKGKVKAYPRMLQPLFPKDLDLVAWQIESYIGVPLLDNKGKNVIGHIAIMDTHPIEDVELVKTVLKTCATRVESELERAIEHTLVRQHKDEKNRQSKKLAHNSSVLEATFESTTDGLLIVNTKGEMLQFNQKFLEIWNIPAQIFEEEEDDKDSPKSVMGILIPQLKNPQFFLNRLKEIYSDPSCISNDTIYFNDGRIIERYSQPQKTDNKIVGRIWSFRDITQKVKIEQELRKSEFLFRSLFEESPIGIVIDDYDTSRIGKINKKFSRMLQYPREELSNMSAADITHPEDGNKHIQSFTEVETQNSIDSSFEKRYITKNGDIIWANVSLSTVRDENNVSLYRVLMIQDITEKKEALLKLNEKNEELQKYINSNMQLENFAYIASHDLREPLLTTMGLVELLIENYANELNEEARSFLQYIDQSVKSMEILINDLLTYSRVNTQEHTVSTFNLQELLESTLAGLQNAIEEQNAVVEFHNIPQTFTANETKMLQLLQNLISNAIKFRKKDTSPSVQITAQDMGEFWQFNVADNGIGIAQEFHDKVFVLFKKLHSKHEYKGTGIGLATCKKIAEQHGGKIWFESEVGKGTTFYFTIAK